MCAICDRDPTYDKGPCQAYDLDRLYQGHSWELDLEKFAEMHYPSDPYADIYFRYRKEIQDALNEEIYGTQK